MDAFAVSTGLTDSSREPRRYLWTDAFAVCNYLELYRQTEEQRYQQLALKLVDQVHQVLGKHRKDSAKSGWLSGLDNEQALLHPTLGGLRIGKRLNERQPDEPVDQALEWDQDGQYFHYLTKWMHALCCVSRDTGDPGYTQWALELAKTAHAAFTYTSAKDQTMHMTWKMSIDLSRPLVTSMGHHDPLDALITYHQLQATAGRYKTIPENLSLDTEILEMKTLCEGRNWSTDDPLGIGSLLTNAYTLFQLIEIQYLNTPTRLEGLLRDIEYSLQSFARSNQLHLSADYRLAFRELGLAIGLNAITRMQQRIKLHKAHFNHVDIKVLEALLTSLYRFYSIHTIIENFWMEPGHQSVAAWVQHADINNVMLATSLAPDSYLRLFDQ